MTAETRADKGAVLVVDDQPHIREVCCQTLERAGYAVVGAGDGAEALRALAEADFDAAVLDIVLPDTSGLELLRVIRDRNPDTVVVMVTGFASLDTAMEAVRLGAYEYLRKPFGAADLARIVERGIESRRLRGRNDELLAELRRVNDELLARQQQPQGHVRLQAEDLAAMVELGRKLSPGTGLTETLEAILAAGVAITRAHAAAVYRLDREEQMLRGLAAINLPAVEVAETHIRPGDGVLGQVAERGAAYAGSLLPGGGATGNDHPSLPGSENVLAVPLTRENEVCGVMAFFDQQDGAFSEQSMGLVGVLAEQAARVLAAMPAEVHAEEAPATEFVDLADLL